MKEFTCNTDREGRNVLRLYKGTDKIVHVPDGVEVLEFLSFANNETAEEIYLPDSVVNISRGAFTMCKELRRLHLPKKLTAIPREMCFSCDKLEQVDIPSSVATIDSGAFIFCSALKEIEIPEGVTQICDLAFYMCDRLERVKLPESLRIIESYAFKGCSALEEIELPKNLRILNDHAFDRCSKIKKLTVPDSVEKVSAGIVSKCSALTELESRSLCFAQAEEDEDEDEYTARIEANTLAAAAALPHLEGYEQESRKNILRAVKGYKKEIIERIALTENEKAFSKLVELGALTGQDCLHLIDSCQNYTFRSQVLEYMQSNKDNGNFLPDISSL